MSPDMEEAGWRELTATSPPPVDLDEEDMDELKQIILEFLSKYEALYEKRIQKLIFYGEVHTAQKTGQRLTDATFIPYDYGPYSQAIRDAIEDLEEEDCISPTPIGQYKTNVGGGELSPKKKYLIDQIHEETKRMSTPEIVDRAKETWLWKNYEYAEEMDFAEYIDDVVIPPALRHHIGDMDLEPVEDADVDRLLSS